MDDDITPVEAAETDIAIVGMAGRFPGAPDVDELWRRIAAAEDCLVDIDEATLRAAGVPDALLGDPEYVRRNGILGDLEMFDAAFFGVGPRDAAIMDPQHRHFLECAWEALETSGHVPERFAGAIGVFAGCGMNTYMLNNLLTNPKLVEQVGMFLLRHTANDKDFFATTLSYKLDLRGPSVNVQTACSTSLVAVHLATQSLLSFECDLALAGGSTIEVPHGVGYVYHEGEVLSPDGVCRAFDERSGGTVLTSGACVVAMRRLSDALDDGDPILAVIKGTAINNDGQRKVGYLAPSVDGHADVVKEALAVAGLSARDIQLFEAHGTGTAVGDPIEVAALTEAYGASTSDRGYCRLVSTKPNIGHLDTAAGVASLIKAVQALRHRTLPPLANHTAPSPLLDLPNTPFVIATTADPWPGDRPRRAGVSSLGVGGTNAHVIVQEAPARPPTPDAVPEQVLAFSGLDEEAVAAGAERLASFLETNSDANLADVAHTLARGRRAMPRRRVVAATDPATAVGLLRSNDRNRVGSATAVEEPPRVVFMFPGGGAHYNGMAAGLDARFSVFHEVMAEGIDRVRQKGGPDLTPLLAADAAEDALRDTTASLPAVFLTSLALARQWMAWGVTPDALLGHSLGEYVAAHLAGVLSLDDALELVVRRSELIGQASGAGAMLAIPLPESEVRPLLRGDLSIATVNASDECVVAGPADAVHALQQRITTDEVSPTLIPLAGAGHSSLLDPILPTFLEVVRGIELSPPQLQYLSNLTGTWITPEQATDPQYWVDHLRHTVRFADCLGTLLAGDSTVLVELGPGHSLSSYARRHGVKPVAAIPSLRHPNQAMDDTAFSLLAAGKAWAAGVDVDLDQFTGEGRRRIRLPGYAFKRERHWIEPGAGMVSTSASPVASVEVTPAAAAAMAPAARPAATRIPDLTDSFWTPSWVERAATPPPAAPIGPWLLVGAPTDPLVAAIAHELGERGVAVEMTPSPHPASLAAARSVVLVGPTDSFDAAMERWLTAGSAVARALGAVVSEPALLAAVTRSATDVSGTAAHPADAMAMGIVGTTPHEYTDVRTALVDLDQSGNAAVDASVVVGELFGGSDRIVAFRGGRRLTPAIERTPVGRADAPTFRRGGNYLVTGGLGGVGFALAKHLAEQHEVNLVVVASRSVPDGVARAEWLARHSYDDPTSRRIRRLALLESLSTKVTVVAADLSDPDAVSAAVEEAERRVGPLDGAIHAAGELRDRPIELATHEDHEVVVGAKARGALALADELARRNADLLVLISSTSTVLNADGQAAYVAANSVLDALAGPHGRLRVVTINYGLWAELGIAADIAHRGRLGIEPGDPVDHPVLSEVHRDRDGTLRIVGTLTSEHHWVIDEHRTSTGTAVLPGTGHLELYLTAAELAGLGDTTIGPISLLEPLIVPDGAAVTVRVTVTDGEDRIAQLESDGGLGSWRLHSEAELSARPAGDAPFLLAIARPDGAVDVDPLARPASQLELGPRWSSVVEAWRTDNEVGGRVALDAAYDAEREAWRAHPALVDVATAFGVCLGEHEQDLYVPVGYEAVRRFGQFPASPRVLARRLDTSTSELLLVDLFLADDAGTVVLSISGLTLHPIHEPAALAAAAPVERTPHHEAHTRISPLVALAEAHGIRATEGAELLERLLATPRPRLIASSIDLADLIAITAEPEAPEHPVGGGTVATPGATTVLGSIRTMWVDLLGVLDVGDDDDFFEVGGHSLIAIRLMSRIAKELGVRFQLVTIFDAPTIAGLAAKVLEARPDLDAELAAAAASTPVTATATAVSVAPAAATSAPPAHKSLVTISPSGNKAPLFIVHGAGGNVLFLWSLARAMAGARPIYGFQAIGVDGHDMPDPSIEVMAARYVTDLRAEHEGPYILGGYSGGGVVAFEMVRQLRALGEDVRYLVLFDSVPPGKADPPELTRWRNILGHIARRGLGPLKPYIKAHLKMQVKRVIPGKAGPEHVAEQRELGQIDVESLGFVDLFWYFSAATEKYDMGSIDVDAALLKAEWVWPSQPHDYYWKRHINGHIDIAEVPGDHHAMFFPENAPRLAETLTELLDHAESRDHRGIEAG